MVTCNPWHGAAFFRLTKIYAVPDFTCLCHFDTLNILTILICRNGMQSSFVLPRMPVFYSLAPHSQPCTSTCRCMTLSFYLLCFTELFLSLFVCHCCLLDLAVRLPALQVVAAVVERLGHTGQPKDGTEVYQAFLQLIAAHYIERCSPWDLPELRVAVHPNAQVSFRLWCICCTQVCCMEPMSLQTEPAPSCDFCPSSGSAHTSLIRAAGVAIDQLAVKDE